ncbi:MAG: Sec-independent protein translocase protein TatB [Corticimicrobacter sp.]|uniref:Sec-independent protein translocase protein TatB n=1 Tax=Corticimicrobacter sp. TaxID=2678536 RepID=UPI0032DB7F8F
MFDISFTELMVIGIIALIVIGPEKLPKVARTIGHLLGRAQRYVNDVKTDIRKEIELDDLKKFKQDMESAASDVRGSIDNVSKSIADPVNQMAREFHDIEQKTTAGLTQTGTTPASPSAGTVESATTAAAPQPGVAIATDSAHAAEPAAPTVATPPVPADTHTPSPAAQAQDTTRQP